LKNLHQISQWSPQGEKRENEASASVPAFRALSGNAKFTEAGPTAM
jgi:hypothetical protein